MFTTLVPQINMYLAMAYSQLLACGYHNLILKILFTRNDTNDCCNSSFEEDELRMKGLQFCPYMGNLFLE